MTTSTTRTTASTSTTPTTPTTPSILSFNEKKILNFWKINNVAKKHLHLHQEKNSASPDLEKRSQVFFHPSGPPFATSHSLHNGHCCVDYPKDSVTRWNVQHGKYVPRQHTTDCHGLPIDQKMEKLFAIKNRDQLDKMDKKDYTDACRKHVNDCVEAWTPTLERRGRWIDTEKDFKTMDMSAIESEWQSFKILSEFDVPSQGMEKNDKDKNNKDKNNKDKDDMGKNDSGKNDKKKHDKSENFRKGLVCQGYKVLPYSIGCRSVLSQMEADLDRRDNTPSISLYVKFPLDNFDFSLCMLNDDEKSEKKFEKSNVMVSLLIYTTTPWSLPANVAVAIKPSLHYDLVQNLNVENLGDAKEFAKEFLIIAKDLTREVLMQGKPKTLKFEEVWKIIGTIPGSNLIGKTYTPPFPYYHHELKSCFCILDGSKFVSSSKGTGIVHVSPCFGEDDYQVCLDNGLIDQFGASPNVVSHIDESGLFLKQIKDFAGQGIYDCQDKILAYLKTHKSYFFSSMTNQSVRFCYRTGVRLIHCKSSSWFIDTPLLKERMIENAKEINWIPASASARFEDRIQTVHPWSISRSSRYWGTPIPIWTNQDRSEVVIIGSIQDLLDRKAVRSSNPDILITRGDIKDLHRLDVDDILLPSTLNDNQWLRRIPDVFDCWFDSACVPFSMYHYPFENKAWVESHIPADWIAEGQDQICAWFFTLHILSTALFNRAAAKNISVMGIVKDKLGNKFSKSQANYEDPMIAVETHGSDALRLFLMGSAVTKGESLKFNNDGIRDVAKDYLLQLHSALNFFLEYKTKWTKVSTEIFVLSPLSDCNSYFDLWIFNELSQFQEQLDRSMKQYHLWEVPGLLSNFILQLTNTFIKSNREALKGKKDVDSWKTSLSTLAYCLFKFSQLSSAFIPFLSELIFQTLLPFFPDYLKNRIGTIESFEQKKHEKQDENKSEQRENVYSVHFCPWPAPLLVVFDQRKIGEIQAVLSTLDLLRFIRGQENIPFVRPIRNAIVCFDQYQDAKDTKDIKDTENQNHPGFTKMLQFHLESEGNILNVEFLNSKECKYLSLVPNQKSLGTKFKQRSRSIIDKISRMSQQEMSILIENKEFLFEKDVVTLSDVVVKSQVLPKAGYVHSQNEKFIIYVNMQNDSELESLYEARQFGVIIQKSRKQAMLHSWDKIEIYYSITNVSDLSCSKSKDEKDSKTGKNHKLIVSSSTCNRVVEKKELLFSKSMLQEIYNVTSCNVLFIGEEEVDKIRSKSIYCDTVKSSNFDIVLCIVKL